MPVLFLYLARIKTGRVQRAWTTIRAESESDAKDLLGAMYGKNNVAYVREVEASADEYYRNPAM